MERGKAITARVNNPGSKLELPRKPIGVRILGIWRAVFEWTVAHESEWRKWKKTRGDVREFEVRMGWRSHRDSGEHRILPATELPRAA
jgi:hypothetical protein